MSDRGPTEEEFAFELAWPDEPVARSVTRPAPPASADASDRDPAPDLLGSEARSEVGGLAEGLRVSRAVIEAQQRIAGRILERLQQLREDLDVDLAAIRTELSALRQQVADRDDTAQRRQLRADVRAVHADVVALRSELAALRDVVHDLQSSPAVTPVGDAASELAALRSEVAELLATLADRPVLPALAPLLEEVSGLRSDVVALKRRIAVRASGGEQR